jgi:hypothetical protein
LLDLQLSEPPLSSLRPAVKRTHACGGAKVYIIDIKICLYIYICAQMYSYESYKARANSGFVRLACVKYCRESMGLIVGVDGALEKASLHLPCITESYAPSSPSHLTVCHQVALSLSSLSVFVERERESMHTNNSHTISCCAAPSLAWVTDPFHNDLGILSSFCTR